MSDWDSENGNGRWRETSPWSVIDWVIVTVVLFCTGVVLRSCH